MGQQSSQMMGDLGQMQKQWGVVPGQAGQAYARGDTSAPSGMESLMSGNRYGATPYDTTPVDPNAPMQMGGGPAAGYQPVGAAGAAPSNAPTRTPGLGLGLGLNEQQRARFQAAAQAGQGATYLGQHQQLARRVQNRIQAGSPQEARLQQFVATGQPQRPMATPYRGGR
jgi:hypothetical protein